MSEYENLPAHQDLALARSKGWSQDEIDHLIRLWPTHSNAQIAARLGRGENAVAVKASRLRLPPKSVMQASPPSTTSKAKYRPCLRCQREFFSEGPANRICNTCKSSRSWRGGQDYVVRLP